MLEDDRKKYSKGTPEKSEEDKYPLEHVGEKRSTVIKAIDNPKLQQELIDRHGLEPDGFLMELKNFKEENFKLDQKLSGGQAKLDMNNDDMLDAKDFEMLRDQNAEGGDIDGQMTMLMMSKKPEEDMLPDDEMEDEYLDFILDEALDNDEEDYLMSQLQDNDQLSMIFDKVIDVAQEFAGSGPVEGPGSGVSDSIPARLSDGEFVFTAKAVEEIGADNLMAMMKDAEMKADDRQGLAEGGEPEEEETVVMPVEQPAARQDIRVTKETVGTRAGQQEEDDLVGEEVKKSMLRGSRNLG